MNLETLERLREPDHVWAARLVHNFPRTWQARVLGAYTEAGAGRDRNLALLGQVRRLSDTARGGISPDAGDAQICEQAQLTADDFKRRLQRVANIAGGKEAPAGPPAPGRRARAAERNAAAAWLYSGFVVRAQIFAARAMLAARGLLDLFPKIARKGQKGITRAGALARLQCPRFWRRIYRKLHARTVEACGISLGLVSRDAGLYASDEACTRRAAQNKRNAATLESITAVNENGQDYTLAELAAKGTANKEIRRVELLTRIAGFELIAKDLGHHAYMVTVTCPSRFHRMTTRAGRAIDNPKYDGSTPDEANRYLTKQWARCRAAAARAGLEWYGFRIAEPQHDATPHWHSILFFPAGPMGAHRLILKTLVEKYFLRADSGEEQGAREHRVQFEQMWKPGYENCSAVGYVIKYVAKNIDGAGVGLDLYGCDAIASSARVESWAATWRIRQFQQIGGAPVTVWRELRRLHPDNIPADAPDSLRAALAAINTAKAEPGEASRGWQKYIAAQGGIGAPRKAQPLKLLKAETGEIGRYGEPMAASAAGIIAGKIERILAHTSELIDYARGVFLHVASERSQWIMATGAQALEVARALVSQRRQAPRTRVNNCTQPETDHAGLAVISGRHTRWGFMPDCVSGFASVREVREKLGRSVAWLKKPRRPAAGTTATGKP